MPERRHMILCTVTDVRDAQIVYPCCSQCCSKLRSDCFQDRWQCLKCGYTSTNGDLDWRYRLSLMVSDGSVLTNVCVFGSVLQQFFGMPSNQFVRFLRKVESMYGNSEDILMLGLKKCFIGSPYYFGIKAMTTSGMENKRTCLADVTQKRHTASQKIILTGEPTENDNVIAFQMVPALDGEIKTVYDIVRNFFKDSNEESVNSESNSCLHSFGPSFSHASKSRIDSFQKSKLNFEQSSLTFGQTTALLSCEMSDISSSTESKSEHVSYSNSDRSNSNVSKVIKMKSKEADFSTASKLFTDGAAKRIDNLNSNESLQEMSSLRNGENKINPALTLKTTVPNVAGIHSSIENKSVNEGLNSEPLFSQDDNSFDLCLNDAPIIQKDNKMRHDGNKLNMENIVFDFDGTLLLQNLKLPDLPDNVPDTEGLDSYLFNDSSFDCSFQNESEYSSNNELPSEDGFKQPLKIVEANNGAHTKIDKQFVSDKNKSQEKPGITHTVHAVENIEENFDNLFEDSFDLDECSNQLNNVKYCTDKSNDHKEETIYEKSVVLEIKPFEENTETLNHRFEKQNKSIDGRTKAFDSEQVLSCAPELSGMNDNELCLEFEKNLSTKITNYVPVVPITDEKEFDSSADLLFNSQCTEFSEVINMSKNVLCQNYVSNIVNTENDENHICESQKDISNVEKSTFGNSSISESVYLDASEDLFGEASVTQESSKKSKRNFNFKILSEDQGSVILGSKSSKKYVQFSRRLSFHKSVQLIDLQMKIHPNMNKLDKNARRKSCLKQTFNKIIESDHSNYQTNDNLCQSRIVKPVENSPIMYNVNSVILSQDLFSPSPDIYLRRLSKPMKITKHSCGKEEQIFVENNNRTSSTPIEIENEEDVDNVDFISKSLISVFSESFGEDFKEEKENQGDSGLNIVNNEDKSPALFSQSCSLFSFSRSKLSEKGDNLSKSYTRGDNSAAFNSVNYSCDLFSPSVCEGKNSIMENMPVKRLFSDKM